MIPVVIPALGRLKRLKLEDCHDFKVSWGYRVRLGYKVRLSV